MSQLDKPIVAAPKLDHLVILASDITASASFYGALLPQLGFNKAKDHIWVSPAGFGIDLRECMTDLSYDRYAPGLNHLAFAVESSAAFDSLLPKLAAAGISLPKVQTFGEAKAVFIPDPDGLRTEIAWEPA